ncbi:MAG: hypothetical protein U9N85_09030 [Bacteroidota bacterium]|nr:hypothetical protein [Bacteroidota bacterium]
MFQKITNIIIPFILLISTTGVSLSKHYSGGELYSISLVGEAESCCTVPCDCCSDESDFYKLVVDYLMSASQDTPDINILNLFEVFDVNSMTLKLDFYVDRSFELIADFSPPELTHSISFLQTFLC